MIILVFAVCLLLYGPYSYSFRQQPGLAIIMVVLVWHMYFLFRSQCYEGPESFLWLVVVEMSKEKANMYGMSLIVVPLLIFIAFIPSGNECTDDHGRREGAGGSAPAHTRTRRRAHVDHGHLYE